MGGHSGRPRLTTAQVIEIRTTYEPSTTTLATVAATYGVHPHCVHAIVTGRTWAWLNDDGTGTPPPGFLRHRRNRVDDALRDACPDPATPADWHRLDPVEQAAHDRLVSDWVCREAARRQVTPNEVAAELIAGVSTTSTGAVA